MLLTFVVPCYNAEIYVQRCIDSIYRCELDEDSFEVLCIDDCSGDGTSEILRRNVELHGNLRVITHEANKGWGGPRNTGVKEARGRYLWFVDSDDEIVGDRLADALAVAEESASDVLCFNYCRIDEAGKELSRHAVFTDTDVLDGYSFVNKVFGASIVHHMGYVWRFLYRTEYLRESKLFFPEKVCWEDTVFMPKALLDADRVASISDVLYAYRVNAESISGVFGRSYPAKLIYEYAFCAGKDLLDFSDEVKDEELKEAFHNTAVQRYINGFPIHLFRTSKYERKCFYKMVRDKYENVELLKQFMKPFPKLLLSPVIGMSLANVISVAYSLKHKKK